MANLSFVKYSIFQIDKRKFINMKINRGNVSKKKGSKNYLDFCYNIIQVYINLESNRKQQTLFIISQFMFYLIYYFKN